MARIARPAIEFDGKGRLQLRRSVYSVRGEGRVIILTLATAGIEELEVFLHAAQRKVRGGPPIHEALIQRTGSGRRVGLSRTHPFSHPFRLDRRWRQRGGTHERQFGTQVSLAKFLGRAAAADAWPGFSSSERGIVRLVHPREMMSSGRADQFGDLAGVPRHTTDRSLQNTTVREPRPGRGTLSRALNWQHRANRTTVEQLHPAIFRPKARDLLSLLQIGLVRIYVLGDDAPFQTW